MRKWTQQSLVLLINLKVSRKLTGVHKEFLPCTFDSWWTSWDILKIRRNNGVIEFWQVVHFLFVCVCVIIMTNDIESMCSWTVWFAVQLCTNLCMCYSCLFILVLWAVHLSNLHGGICVLVSKIVIKYQQNSYWKPYIVAFFSCGYWKRKCVFVSHTNI